MSSDHDRTVHARLEVPMAEVREIVRYDKQGRWYSEWSGGKRQRLTTVAEAARTALDFEAYGGEIYPGQPGGQQFDTKVAGARQRQSRGVRR